MSHITISNISKSFQEKHVLRSINLEVRHGEFLGIFGPNGCGKSTLLNIVAGILSPDKGAVTIDTELPNKNTIGYVFQNYRDSLLPWKKNIENIAFPLEIRGIAKKERLERAEALARAFELPIPLSRYPYQSSGGEQQLVALLREVIAQPKVILMDEPFSALHHESRKYLKIKVQEIWQKLRLTIILVSHDILETIQLADRIITMKSSPGEIVQTMHITLPRIRTEESVYVSQYYKKLMGSNEGLLPNTSMSKN